MRSFLTRKCHSGLSSRGNLINCVKLEQLSPDSNHRIRPNDIVVCEIRRLRFRFPNLVVFAYPVYTAHNLALFISPYNSHNHNNKRLFYDVERKQALQHR